MSGGSYNYFCFKIEEFADEIFKQADRNPLRIAFSAHLRKIAKAARDIEWVDSGDFGPGDENAGIEAVLKQAHADPNTLAKAAAYDEVKKWFGELNKPEAGK